MNPKNLLSFLGGLILSTVAFAQTDYVPVDWEKYPDYQGGNFNPDPAAVQFVQRYQKAKSKGRSGVAATGRPDHVHNGMTKYFAPVFNQSSGSCGAASRIGYMFTHEQNSYRDLDGSKPENYYPTHFVFLLTYGNSGKNEFVLNVGIPSAKTYGGQTYSNLFGYNEWDDEDYGWMTGYDKWYEAFHNKCEKITSVPFSLGTEEGREFAKNWLWNHCGDTSFKAGGLIGLGVASGGQWHRIPKTAANDAAGVTDKYYVHEWGVSVDHALTMVGYDDRIEFDLDGNGIYGEKDKDEVGAWIIVNSWGNWCNNGFIYCPYAHAGATFNNDAEAGKRTFNKNSWWYGELYHARKDYRPLRTIKLKMDYTHRSELLLQAGVSTDLKATSPQSLIQMDHFKYAGDGHNGDLDPAPEVPMLGKWADGKMHTEPMEFGYDLTDLSAGYDRNQPLKYFFVITRKKSTNKGSGHIYEASIMDYENDLEGVETPFDLGESGTYEITTRGTKTIISCIVYGAGYNAPNSLAYDNGTLVWSEPDRSGHTVVSYNIYKGGVLVDNVQTLSWKVTDTANATYSVTALYSNGKESSKVSVNTPIVKPESNEIYDFAQAGFTIPDLFKGSYDKATIEYWFRPAKLENWNNAVGPGWGTWLQHCGADGKYYVGWNTNARITSTTMLTANKWYHIAIVVNKNTCTLYINGTSVGSVTSDTYSGIGGFGDLVFSSSAGSNYWQSASYDEIRIWNTARTSTQIRSLYATSAKNVPELFGEVMPDGLLAYYKGDSFQGEDGQWYMRDCVGGYHAKVSTSDSRSVASDSPSFIVPTKAGSLTINNPGTVYAGRPVTLTAKRGDFISQMQWTTPVQTKSLAPTVVFPAAGEYEIAAKGVDYAGTEFPATLKVTVLDAPEINAAFKLSKSTVAAGEHLSFAPVECVTGYSYEWSTPGAQVEKQNGNSAGTTYDNFGSYTVTLTVTDGSGKKASSSQEVTVTEVAPLADFAISKPVVLVGETVDFIDKSKYSPSRWQWLLSGTAGNVVIKGRDASFTTENPGIYDVCLTASNNAGKSTSVVEGGLVVVNADSKNGLSFGSTANVTASKVPLNAGQTRYTIEWWMNPSKLSSYCMGIGATDATFQIKTDASGKLIISNKGQVASSADPIVEAGKWHHYAITVSSTTVTFYKDGQKVSSSGSVTSGFANVPNFSIGTSGAGWNGSIDELRIWTRNLTANEIKAVANQPLSEDVSTMYSTLKNEELALYYDFNQSGGDVQDRSQSANNGVRTGFGPDGDAWGLSRGVFSLNLSETGTTTDISSNKLTNFKRSFARTTKQVNTSTANRFYEIKDWKLENQVIDGTTVTGVHVDTQKSSDFTCTTGWDGFGSLSNHKAYQVMDLEPGVYTFSVTFGQHGAAGKTYLVAAEGETLPNGDELDAKAIGYAPLSDRSVKFIVTENKKVSLGILVESMSGQSIFTIQKFQLTQSPIDIRVVTGLTQTGADKTINEDVIDLAGRSVSSPVRNNVYIKNGQKYIIR